MKSQVGAGPASRRRGYALCATQRTGSNYLCQLLSSTGVLGRPLDYFNAAGRRKKGWSDYPDDRRQQLEIVARESATPNGVYGFKLFAYDFDTLAPLPWTTYLPNLHWIFLYRRDLLGQAISLALAKLTDRWRSTDGPRVAPLYDAAAIDREIEEISRDNAAWFAYFARNDLNPLVLSYEELLSGPEAAVAAIASKLDIDDPAVVDRSAIDLAVQRDAVDAEWRRRYVAERSNLSRFRASPSVEG